eukprot:5172793-Pleurochrysis_carterae.AAC.1
MAAEAVKASTAVETVAAKAREKETSLMPHQRVANGTQRTQLQLHRDECRDGYGQEGTPSPHGVYLRDHSAGEECIKSRQAGFERRKRRAGANV